MIRTEINNEILTVALSRPDKRNALTPAMLQGIADAAAAVEPTVRVIVLTGDGETFCSGFDLSLCREDRGALAGLLSGLSRAVRALRRSAVPVVAAAQGAAVAGGCALLCGADFVVADAGAKFGYPVVRLGISPAVNATFLRQSLGDGQARARLLDGVLFDGREAQRLGLIWHLVERPGDVLPRAMDFARGLATKPVHALAATKGLLNELDGSNDDATIDAGLAASLAIADSPEATERLTKLWTR